MISSVYWEAKATPHTNLMIGHSMDSHRTKNRPGKVMILGFQHHDGYQVLPIMATVVALSPESDHQKTRDLRAILEYRYA
jgi:hypothetical protein